MDCAAERLIKEIEAVIKSGDNPGVEKIRQKLKELIYSSTREDTANKSGVELLDASEAVAFLGGKFSRWTIYELVRKKQIPHLKIERRVYFRPESLINWLAELEAASITKPETPVSAGKIHRLK